MGDHFGKYFLYSVPCSSVTSFTYLSLVPPKAVLANTVSTSTYTTPITSLWMNNLPPGNVYVPLSHGSMTSDAWLVAIESQLTMIAKSMNLVTQLYARAYRPIAVPPEKFHLDKSHNLKQFFRILERYCELSYPDQQFWLTILVNFLKGLYSVTFIIS